jgi:hypothetical protein
MERLNFFHPVLYKCVYLHKFPLDKKVTETKIWWGVLEKKNTEELSKMFKYTDKTTKHDLNWNKELREELQFI